MLYVFNAVSDQAYDRAYKYARALEPYLVEGVVPEKVRERIENDGKLEKLYDRAKKEIFLRKGKSKEPEEQEWNDDDPELGTRPETGDDEEGAEGQTGGRKASARQPKRASRVRLTLNIEVSPERLERAFGMAKGQEGIVRFKALGVEDDWSIQGHEGQRACQPTQARGAQQLRQREIGLRKKDLCARLGLSSCAVVVDLLRAAATPLIGPGDCGLTLPRPPRQRRCSRSCRGWSPRRFPYPPGSSTLP